MKDIEFVIPTQDAALRFIDGYDLNNRFPDDKVRDEIELDFREGSACSEQIMEKYLGQNSYGIHFAAAIAAIRHPVIADSKWSPLRVRFQLYWLAAIERNQVNDEVSHLIERDELDSLPELQRQDVILKSFQNDLSRRKLAN